MTAAADVLIGVVPVVLAAAFLLLIVQSMGDRATGLVDKMKQAVGGAVMLLVTLLVVFAFLGGGGGDDPGPDPPEPAEEYDVSFHVASDSQGYGTVSISGLSDVPEGTSVTVGQTIIVGTAGQCAATPAADTSEYVYAFSHWTGADDSGTPAPTSITADTHYYAHFTRSDVPPDPVYYDVYFHVATDSQGYGTVSAASLSDVLEGTGVTVAQTIAVGGAGQCTATPSVDTAQYRYAFTGWTGADDASTPAPTTISADTHYYAHFARETREYTVSFHVATDSQGYGTVSPASIASVPYGTAVTVAQTLIVGSAGQCTATPAADTSEYVYAFSGWTGADDSSTAAPAVISGDTAYYAHFTRTAIPQPMDPSLFTFTVANSKATVTGWAGTPPADGYDLWFPTTDGQGHPLTAIGDLATSSISSPWAGAGTLKADTVTTVGKYTFHHTSSLTAIDLPAATTIGNYAFNMSSVSSVSLPAATTLMNGAFSGCGRLTAIDLPAATSIDINVFSSCSRLAVVNLPAATSIGNSAFVNSAAITSVTFGPLATVGSTAFPSWTFYNTNGTTVLDKTVAANLANSTFEGTASALVKVAPGAKSLSEDMGRRVLELTAENQAKAAMLAEIDPALAGMDASDVARMTVDEIRSLTPEDVESMKAEIERRRAADEGEPPGGE